VLRVVFREYLIGFERSRGDFECRGVFGDFIAGVWVEVGS